MEQISRMSAAAKTYCIRRDYVARVKAETLVEDSADYWNPSRIATSGLYQYYVYRRAAEIAGGMEGCAYLDIGCGYPTKTGLLVAPRTKDITLMDQPSMEPVVNKNFPGMKFIPANLEDIGFALDRKFDCVVCSDVIEHLLDPDPLVAFIKAAVSERGVAIFSTPERDVERGKDCLGSPNPQHVREWNAAEFAEYLRASGFVIVEQRLTPVKRVSRLEELALPLLALGRTSRYAGCQMVVCKPR